MTKTEASDFAALEQQLADLREAILGGASDSLPMVEMLLRDTQRRVAAERELADNRAWMDLAQEAGGVAAYRMDIPANRLWWSNSVYTLYGMAASDGEPTVERWLATIHPADRENVATVARSAIEHGEPIDHHFRIILPTGDLRWVHDRGRVDFDERGRPSMIHGVNVDISALRRTQEDLALSEGRTREAFEFANVGVAHVALDGRFLEVNRYLSRMLARDPDELAGLTFQDITHPDDLDADLHLLERLVAGAIPSYTLEKRYIRPGGDVVWADLSVSCLRDGDGRPVNFISIVTDIAERKAAQKQLELVLAEANHRVKNLLAVVSAIVTNSARTAGTAPDLAQRILLRLQGIAVSHDLLTGKSERGGDLGELIKRQLEIFTDCDARRVTLSGPPVRLNPATAHAFGMVLHELATNACKYGSLSGDAGTVTISWRVDPTGDGLHFEWVEHGGPKVAPTERRGFGSKALSRMLTGPLGGQVTHELPVDGARFTASVPLSTALHETSA